MVEGHIAAYAALHARGELSLRVMAALEVEPYAFAPFPDHLTAMMRDGGLIAHLKRSAASQTGAAA